MVILFCTNTFESSGNGPSKFAKFILELNDRDGIELHILTEDISNSIKNVHKVKVRKGIIASKIGMLTRIKDYNNAINTFIDHNKKPDIIVFNNAITGIRTYKRLDIPVIGMINDQSSAYYNELYPKFSQLYLRHTIFHFYEQRACKSADRIIVNSKSLLHSIIDKYQIAQEKISILYKSINTDIEGISDSFQHKEIVRVLFVKTDWNRGGLLDLIKALNLLNTKFKLVVIGPNLANIKNIRQYIGTNNKLFIDVKGACSQEEVFHQMKNSDIFCTPSHQEALGVANMEAMILKLPVVYTNIGGIPEVMDYGKNGFVAEANNPQSLANALSKCIENETERNLKVKSGYKFVKNNFKKNSMFDAFIEICSIAIKSKYAI